MEQSPELSVIREPLVKLALVYDTENFLPVSRRELNEAFALGSFSPKQGGAAGHLNEILRHQIPANTDDPNRAVRSVANEYVGYYRSAILATEQLNSLAEDIHGLDNPNASLGLRLRLDHIGLAGMIRFMDLRKVVDRQEIRDGEINPLSIDYTDAPTVDTLRYIANILKNLRVGSVKTVVQLAVEDQINRGNFWHERLVESTRHATARPIVERALKLQPGSKPQDAH